MAPPWKLIVLCTITSLLQPHAHADAIDDIAALSSSEGSSIVEKVRVVSATHTASQEPAKATIKGITVITPPNDAQSYGSVDRTTSDGASASTVVVPEDSTTAHTGADLTPKSIEIDSVDYGLSEDGNNEDSILYELDEFEAWLSDMHPASHPFASAVKADIHVPAFEPKEDTAALASGEYPVSTPTTIPSDEGVDSGDEPTSTSAPTVESSAAVSLENTPDSVDDVSVFELADAAPSETQGPSEDSALQVEAGHPPLSASDEVDKAAAVHEWATRGDGVSLGDNKEHVVVVEEDSSPSEDATTIERPEEPNHLPAHLDTTPFDVRSCSADDLSCVHDEEPDKRRPHDQDNIREGAEALAPPHDRNDPPASAPSTFPPAPHQVDRAGPVADSPQSARSLSLVLDETLRDIYLIWTQFASSSDTFFAQVHKFSSHSLENLSLWLDHALSDAYDGLLIALDRASALHTWWQRDVLASNEDLQLLVRNAWGLALLALLGAAYGSLYVALSHAPRVGIDLWRTLDDATKDKARGIGFVSIVASLVLLKAMWWYWATLATAAAFYYWSGNVTRRHDNRARPTPDKPPLRLLRKTQSL